MDITSLQHSPFLESLGWAIANSLWQAASLWIVYFSISGVYKNASAHFKTNAATLLLSATFLWFLFTISSKYFSLINIHGVDAITQQYQNRFINADPFTNTQWQLMLLNITAALPYLSAAYLLLLVFLSLRLVNSYRYTNFIKSAGLQKPSVKWKLFTEKVARHIGITKKINLWISHNIDVPATIGFLKPVILIPVASINQLSEDQLEAIILHELSHIKRNDYIINIFVSLVETILFFNPFVVLLSKIIKRERENCCDDFVIQYQYDRHSYASALLSLEQCRNTKLRLAISATSGKKQLLHRVKRIMEAKNSSSFNYGQKLLALLIITGIFCSVAWLSPSTKNISKQIIQNPKDTFIKKIAPLNSNSINKTINSDNKIKQQAITLNHNGNEENKSALLNKITNNNDKKSVNLANKLNESQTTENENDFENFEELQPENRSAKLDKLNLSESLKKTSSFNFNTKELTTAAMQKYQYIIEQNNFKKFFDDINVESNVKQALDYLQKGNLESNVFKKLKKEELENLIISLINNNNSRHIKKVQITPDPFNALRLSHSGFKADSLFVETRKKINNPVRIATVNNVGKVGSINNLERRYTTPTTPAFGYTYTSKDSYNAFSFLRPRVAKSDNHIEYNNGVITINGKTVKSPDREKSIAQVKGKKLSIISGDNIIEININN